MRTTLSCALTTLLLSGAGCAANMDAGEGAGGAGEEADREHVGSAAQALGIESKCPTGTSYDFTYGNAKLLLCSQRDVTQTDSNVTRAIVAIRGSGWKTCDYDCYYKRTLAEAKKAGMDLDKLDIIAPRFLMSSTCEQGNCTLYGDACSSDSDCRPAGYHRWSSSYVRGGQDATGNGVLSYELLDALLFQLAVTRPNLEIIVVAGQSQGAQLVNRYALSSILSSGGGTTLRYWSANAGSYPWFDATRPDPASAAQCAGYNNWAVGGLDNLYQYHLDRNVDAGDMIANAFTRDIYWTVGADDNVDYAADAFCGNSQGPYRTDRWANYRQHTTDECLDRQLPHCASFSNDRFLQIPDAEHGMKDSWEHPIGHKILFDTVHAACSSSAVDYEVFNESAPMVGCAGKVSYANRNTLCGPGFTACGADQWVHFRDRDPHYNYWTSSALRYGGSSEGNCWVHETSGSSCPSGSPMRVCTENIAGLPTGTDPLGNTCNWDHCGYQGSTQNEFFGGCIGDTTAGTLCCPMPQ